MLLALKLGCLVILGWILVEDLRFRAVRWYLFPALAVLLAMIFLSEGRSLGALTARCLINVSFVALQAIILTGYFCLKHHRWVNIFNGLLGLGDVLFLLAIAVYLPLFIFIGFYIVSLIVVLLGWFLYKAMVRHSGIHIPLAGLQAGLFMLLFFSCWFWPSVNATLAAAQADSLMY